MKKITFLSALIIAICSLGSCIQKILLKKVGAFDESATTKQITNGDKTIVFVPMHHVGKKEFYNDVRHKIDSLQKNGYIIYYEGTKPDLNTDSLTADTITRKLRMITQIDPMLAKKQGGYVDTVNSTFLGVRSKYIASEKLRNQPYAVGLGIDTSKAVRADVFYSDIIRAFENKYGKLPLSDCDMKSPLGQKYKCKKSVKNKQKMDILMNSRNEYLYDVLLKENRKKIAVIFGAKHFNGLLKMLKEKDPSWKKIN